MKTAIVIGSGAGGATIARELQGKFEVTVLEAGRNFRPFSQNLSWIEKLRKTELLFDEREIGFLFPSMKIRKTGERMILVNGIGFGGTTTISAGNALRVDRDLKALGIDLDEEFAELGREIPISVEHRRKWRESTKRLFAVCLQMNLDPNPTPKMVDVKRCRQCGRCVLGCRWGAKWDSRRFLTDAVNRGARLDRSCRVERIEVVNGRASGAWARQGFRNRFFPADLVILAAGGLGTPVILQNSGIPCESRLFVDPVLCVAAEWPGSLQDREIPMPFVVQRDRYIVSPYFDYLSFFFNRKWRFPSKNIVSLMIKLADATCGGISGKRLDKTLTPEDHQRLGEGVELCREILVRFGVKRETIFLGTLNAGHPGGMVPLSAAEAASFHPPRLPENLYVADATLFPDSLGNPPILTIMAMAMRIARICIGSFS